MNTGAKILLIEDDRSIAETLRRVLTDEGHPVTVESRGDTGLVRARDGTFNVVLTDLRLPCGRTARWEHTSHLAIGQAQHRSRQRLACRSIQFDPFRSWHTVGGAVGDNW